jgi:hypothetical protein
MSEELLDTRLAAEWRLAVSAAAPPAITAAAAEPSRASRTAIAAELEDVRLSVEESRGVIERAQSRLATRRWSVRDVAAHLASWSWRTRVEAERLITGEPFDEIIPFGVDGPHAWNQREVDARRSRSLAELFDEIDAEHVRLTDLVAGMSDDQASRLVTLPRTIGDPAVPWLLTIGAMILMSCWHARLHLRRIARITAGTE